MGGAQSVVGRGDSEDDEIRKHNSGRVDERGANGSVVGADHETRKRMHRRQLEFEEDDISPQIQEFAKNIYDAVSYFAVFDNILSNEKGVQAFKEFLTNDYAAEALQFYLDCGHAIESARRAYMRPTKKLYDQYLHPTSGSSIELTPEIKRRLTTLASSEENAASETEELTKYLTAAQGEIKQMLSVAAVPKFLSSHYFIVWRDEQERTQQRLVVDASVKKDAAFTRGLSGKTAMRDEFSRFLNSNDWLKALVGSFEDIPVCISIASASADMRGFPLVYVNKCFEEITGYNRSEIIGQNCRFLQYSSANPELKAEPDSIARLSMGLSNGETTKVMVTNFKKDGTPFKNLLALKPIFDEVGDYAFVVGIQFDCGQQDGNIAVKFQMADTFFRLVPNKVPHALSREEASFINSVFEKEFH
jgi:PAS domain S-box-containing protein